MQVMDDSGWSNWPGGRSLPAAASDPKYFTCCMYEFARQTDVGNVHGPEMLLTLKYR